MFRCEQSRQSKISFLFRTVEAKSTASASKLEARNISTLGCGNCGWRGLWQTADFFQVLNLWLIKLCIQKKKQNKINLQLPSPPAPEMPTAPSWSSSQGMSLRWVYFSLWIPLTPATSHHLLIHSTNIYWKASVQDRTGQKFLQSSAYTQENGTSY